MNTATSFDIASVSKQFTGLAIEMLIDRGEVGRDDAIDDLVPTALPGAAGVTLQELLTHTSGLADYGDLLDAEYDEPASQEEAVAAVARSTRDLEAGFAYSNSNYLLLAEVVTAVDGRDLPTFLAEELFDPLELDMELDPDVASDPRSAAAENVAVGEEWPVRWTQVGDGSVVATPGEMVTWSEQYWDQTLDGPTLARLGYDDAAEDPEGGVYGSGVEFVERDGAGPLVTHTGSWGGTVTDWVVDPDARVAVAVSCNTEDGLDSDSPAGDLLEIWT